MSAHTSRALFMFPSLSSLIGAAAVSSCTYLVYFEYARDEQQRYDVNRREEVKQYMSEMTEHRLKMWQDEKMMMMKRWGWLSLSFWSSSPSYNDSSTVNKASLHNDMPWRTRGEMLKAMQKTATMRRRSSSSSSSSSSSGTTGANGINHHASSGLFEDELDVLVIGGGATGAGCALDAVTRGLKTALIEREDFSSGTSSRSTKLLHGGVRYLEKAVMGMDPSQLKLVFEALHERAVVMNMAPHLTSPLPILMPCYTWWHVPYFWAGMKAYDFLSGTRMLSPSFAQNASETLRSFPMLRERLSDDESCDKGSTSSTTNPSKASKLCGSITYYDGQMDDSRLNVMVATTAASVGALCANYVEVIDVLRETDFPKGGGRQQSQSTTTTTTTNTTTNSGGEGEAKARVCGVKVRDRLSGKEFNIRAKVIINAAGPFCDDVREKVAKKKKNTQDGDVEFKRTVTPAAGAHLSLPQYYVPDGMGLIIPKTKDGRVLFILPWMGISLAGTTDSPSELTMRPKATQDDISFILKTVSSYIEAPVEKEDILSAWSGIRPLASDPSKSNTESISRDHVCFVEEESGLVSITGGKWTTFRKMAKDAVDLAIKTCDDVHPVRDCCTSHVILDGASQYDRTLHIRLAKALSNMVQNGKSSTSSKHGTKRTSRDAVRKGTKSQFQSQGTAALQSPSQFLDTGAIGKRLATAYGDKAWHVLAVGESMGLLTPLVEGHPILEAEVVYAARNEFCMTASDFLARRSRLAFTDAQSAERALPRVIELLGKEHKWSSYRSWREKVQSSDFLTDFR